MVLFTYLKEPKNQWNTLVILKLLFSNEDGFILAGLKETAMIVNSIMPIILEFGVQQKDSPNSSTVQPKTLNLINVRASWNLIG